MFIFEQKNRILLLCTIQVELFKAFEVSIILEKEIKQKIDKSKIANIIINM